MFFLKPRHKLEVANLTSLFESINDLLDNVLRFEYFRTGTLSWLISLEKILHATSLKLCKFALAKDRIHVLDHFGTVDCTLFNVAYHLTRDLFNWALRVFQFLYLSVNYANDLIHLGLRSKHALLVSQVSNVEHYALLVSENDFVTLKAVYSFSRLFSQNTHLATWKVVWRVLMVLTNFERLANNLIRVPLWDCTLQANLDLIVLLVGKHWLVKNSL